MATYLNLYPRLHQFAREPFLAHGGDAGEKQRLK